MSIKVLIERKSKEAPTPELLRIIEEIRMEALGQDGYISGETLVNTENPKEILVVSTWQKLEDWEQWKGAEKREKLETKLTPYLKEAAEIRIFYLGENAIAEAFEKFFHEV